MTSARSSLIAGTLFGVTGVVLGAWGAHGLQTVLPEADLSAWATAVQYQLVHALALLICGIVLHLQPGRMFGAAALLFATGVILFSGSLYLLTFGAPRWLGPVTPLGGTALIAGWLCLFGGASRWR